MLNPFCYGNPVSASEFKNRRRELGRITSRIMNHGQSTAIVGEPRSGKTSLLIYLATPEMWADLRHAEEPSLLFTYMDAQTLGSGFSQPQFWEYAMQPLRKHAITRDPHSALALAYETCQENHFGAFVLELLLARMESAKWRLILLLDEFDMLLHHPILNSAEFFGSLRSLASRSHGALVLVIASRRSLDDLNKETQELSRTGSPFFNIFREITLGPFPDGAAKELLSQAGDRFTSEDHDFIKQLAGGHPYLLQAAASALWEAYQEGVESGEQRHHEVGQVLYEESSSTLSETWHLWTPQTRKAITAVTLGHISALGEREELLGKHEFHTERLIRDLPYFKPELHLLEKQGHIAKDGTISGGWRIRPLAFLRWLADELVRAARAERSFEDWLGAQALDGVLTREEKQYLGRAASALGSFLKDIIATFTGTVAKSAGEVVGKRE